MTLTPDLQRYQIVSRGDERCGALAAKTTASAPSSTLPREARQSDEVLYKARVDRLDVARGFFSHEPCRHRGVDGRRRLWLSAASFGNGYASRRRSFAGPLDECAAWLTGLATTTEHRGNLTSRDAGAKPLQRLATHPRCDE